MHWLQMGGDKSLFGRKKNDSGMRTPTNRSLKRDLKEKMSAKPRFIKKKKFVACFYFLLNPQILNE